jgi:D-aminoacyl-tRNA deacylase
MKIAIITSKKDQAGMNIKNSLIFLFDFKKSKILFDQEKIFTLKKNNIKINIYTLSSETIFTKDLDKKIKEDMFIFATKHESSSKIPTLSLHTPGNFSIAKYGGKDRSLCISCPNLMKIAFKNLNRLGKNLKFQVTLECTHHGPFINNPCMFIEIGSNIKAWKDKAAGDIIAKTIINSIIKLKNSDFIPAIGIGGNHYCPQFNKIMLNTNISLGHICPKYELQNLDRNLLLQMLKRTNIKTKKILIDWKGLGKYKQDIMNLLKNLNLPYMKTKEILKN